MRAGFVAHAQINDSEENYFFFLCGVLMISVIFSLLEFLCDGSDLFHSVLMSCQVAFKGLVFA